MRAYTRRYKDRVSSIVDVTALSNKALICIDKIGVSTMKDLHIFVESGRIQNMNGVGTPTVNEIRGFLGLPLINTMSEKQNFKTQRDKVISLFEEYICTKSKKAKDNILLSWSELKNEIHG